MFPPLVWSVILDFLPEKIWWKLKLNKSLLRLIAKKLTAGRPEDLIKRGLIESFKNCTFFRPRCYYLLALGGHMETLRWLVNKNFYPSVKTEILAGLVRGGNIEKYTGKLNKNYVQKATLGYRVEDIENKYHYPAVQNLIEKFKSGLISRYDFGNFSNSVLVEMIYYLCRNKYSEEVIDSAASNLRVLYRCEEFSAILGRYNLKNLALKYANIVCWKTVFSYACLGGHLDFVQVLFSAMLGENLNMAYYMAAKKNRENILEFLKKKTGLFPLDFILNGFICGNHIEPIKNILKYYTPQCIWTENLFRSNINIINLLKPFLNKKQLRGLKKRNLIKNTF